MKTALVSVVLLFSASASAKAFRPADAAAVYRIMAKYRVPAKLAGGARWYRASADCAYYVASRTASCTFAWNLKTNDSDKIKLSPDVKGADALSLYAKLVAAGARTRHV